MENFRNKLNILIEQIVNINNMLNDIIINLEKYYSIYKSIINNYDIKKRNYWMLKNLKNINFNSLFNDIDIIINEKDINKKIESIFGIYNKMNYKNNIKIEYNYSKKSNKIQLFGDVFIKNNKENKEKCKIIIDNNEKDLIKYYEIKNKKNGKLEIILKVINKIKDISHMFNECILL